MAKNNMPKTAVAAVNGLDLTLNQNGRVIHGIRTPKVADDLLAAGLLTRENGMLFVPLETLASAFGLVMP